MRLPTTIETLYLDFDGFFASVLQQAFPELRGRPIGVIPFEADKARFTSVIACSKEAKFRGVQNVMRVPDALAICPDLCLVTQRPDLFRRAHNTLLNEIRCEIPIDVIKSIDELACQLSPVDSQNPAALAARLKSRIAQNVGQYITCSIGFAANRLLAKMACKMDKPDGVTIWHPSKMPTPLLPLPLSDISGIGSKMERRLNRAGIESIADLLATQPKQARALWGSVHGERMWYALHGYDIKAEPTDRGMYGHGRVLPPQWRNPTAAYECLRMLLTKAARRMRRDGWHSSKLLVWVGLKNQTWVEQRNIPAMNDDQGLLTELKKLFDQVQMKLERTHRLVRVGVSLLDLSSVSSRQLDMFRTDDADRQKWECLTRSIDRLNRKFGKRVISVGPWTTPPGGHTGAKIAFTRIPSAEDFW